MHAVSSHNTKTIRIKWDNNKHYFLKSIIDNFRIKTTQTSKIFDAKHNETKITFYSKKKLLTCIFRKRGWGPQGRGEFRGTTSTGGRR